MTVSAATPRQKANVTLRALRDAHRLGLADEDEAIPQIQRMLYLSAPLRDHPRGNRRYEEWVFRVEGKLAGGKRVTAVHLINCPVCEDRKRIHVPDEERQLLVPCPNCTRQHRDLTK